MRRARLLLLATLTTASAGPGCATEAKSDARALLVFEPGADLTAAGHFYDFPYPSDLRTFESGAPDLRGAPDPLASPAMAQLRAVAMDRKGFPQVPVAYFRFSAPLAARDLDAVIAPEKTAPVLLVDVDRGSVDRGKLYPTVATQLAADAYTPENVLAVAARPGIVLAPHRTYAFVVMASYDDASGSPLGVADNFAHPTDARVSALYAPLWETLQKLGVDGGRVAAATVFTTGDVVEESAKLTNDVGARYDVEIHDLKVQPGAATCTLVGRVTYPQFQRGAPPFATEGTFEIVDGVPKRQREEDAPVVLTLPNGAMPNGGFSLVVVFRGSGTDSPADVLAQQGLATATSALPMSPARVPGATETAYLNVANPAAMRDTFRQGVLEQRLFIQALSKVHVSPEALARCPSVTLPSGETSFHFATDPLLAQGGPSIGAMYTNLVGALEPRVRAVVATGAAGYWSYLLTKTTLVPDAFRLADVPLSFVHPVMHLFETAIEPVDPLVSMPRLARRPLPGHVSRSVYEPVGRDDASLPIAMHDAVALGYGHKQSGEIVWPSMQEALGLVGLQGLLPYPVSQNMQGIGSQPYTAAVVQYERGADNAKLEAVKYQSGCFFKSFVTKGIATIPAPAPIGTPCPM